MRHLFLLQRFPLKTIGWKNWVQKLLEVEKDSQQTQPKTKTQLASTERLVIAQPPGLLTKEIEKDVSIGCESTNLRTERPVKSCEPVSVEREDKDKDVDENVDADQTRTVRPVSGQPTGLFTQLKEMDIDFRVSGLPPAVVTQAENFRVRELVKKIESHPHRRAPQADLQQNNADNPFSDDSKAMIREMGNLELFDLWETIPKVQCSQCLLYWKQGKVYCTCGHLLVESESSQYSNKWRLDALSIPHYVIKKGRPHGPRHRKTEAQKEHYAAHDARKRCIKWNYEGIHDRFQRDSTYRDSQLKIDWTEEKCIAMDKLAQEYHSYTLSREEYLRYQKHWYLTMNKSGKNAPMRLRSDFRAAVTIMSRLHRGSGEERAEPIPFLLFHRWHPSSSSSSWWNWDKSWWSSWEFFFFWKLVVVGSFTSDSNLLQPTGGVNSTPQTSPFFSFTARTHNDVWYHIGSSVCARHPIYVSCVWVIVCSLFDPHFALFRVFLYLPLLLLPEPWLLPFPLPCGCPRSKIPCALRPMRSLALWPITPLSQNLDQQWDKLAKIREHWERAITRDTELELESCSLWLTKCRRKPMQWKLVKATGKIVGVGHARLETVCAIHVGTQRRVEDRRGGDDRSVHRRRLGWRRKVDEIDIISVHKDQWIHQWNKCTAAGCADGLYEKAILNDMGMRAKINLRCDPKAAGALAQGQGCTKQTRHVKVKYVYVQDLVKAREVEVLRRKRIWQTLGRNICRVTDWNSSRVWWQRAQRTRWRSEQRLQNKSLDLTRTQMTVSTDDADRERQESTVWTTRMLLQSVRARKQLEPGDDPIETVNDSTWDSKSQWVSSRRVMTNTCEPIDLHGYEWKRLTHVWSVHCTNPVKSRRTWMSLVSIQQLRIWIFSWNEFFWNPTVRLKESTVVGACWVSVFARDITTMLRQLLLSQSCAVGGICSYQHIDIARRPWVISVSNTFAITTCAAHVWHLSHFASWW